MDVIPYCVRISQARLETCWHFEMCEVAADLFNMIHKQAEITVRYPKCIVLKRCQIIFDALYANLFASFTSQYRT
jgi:hypothetical protein